MGGEGFRAPGSVLRGSRPIRAHRGSHDNADLRSMLILTRRIHEALMIGDDITVTVLGVSGKQVRAGITAPNSVSVHREEVYERIRNETRHPSKSRGNNPQAGIDGCGQ